MPNLDQFKINPTNEFHILRHFKYVENTYKESLINQPYWYYDYNKKKFVSSVITKQKIKKALETISSKFNTNVKGIETPKKLMLIIQEQLNNNLQNNKITWSDQQDYKMIKFTFDYKINVGYKNCLPVSSIKAKDQSKIVITNRSNCTGENEIMVNTITNKKLIPTKTIYVEVIKNEQLPFYLITAFPYCLEPENLSISELLFVL